MLLRMHVFTKGKIVFSAMAIAAVSVVGTAHANEVNLVINNATSATLYLVSGSPYGKFPSTIQPGQKYQINPALQFGGSRSDIEVVYERRDTGSACRFTASHIERPTLGPFFDKSADSVGAGYASCQALQSPSWQPPYNYSAEFAYYY